MVTVRSALGGLGNTYSRVATGTAAGLVMIAALVTGVAARAQHLAVVGARAGGYPAGLYSLPGHVLAMTTAAGFAVLVGTMAARHVSRWMALAVAVGVALGPMELVAAPVRAGLVSVSDQDTVLGWHLVVATPIVLVLVVTTNWNVACLRAGHDRVKAHPTTDSAPRWPAPGSVFAVVAAVAVLLQAWFGYSVNNQKPGLLAILGWAVVAGAQAAVLVRHHGRWKVPVILSLGSGATLVALWLPYLRVGGWPGVAGWEIIQPPIILSVVAVLVVLAPPLLALLWFALRAGSHAFGNAATPRNVAAREA